jgi:hypothetical protein
MVDFQFKKPMRGLFVCYDYVMSYKKRRLIATLFAALSILSGVVYQAIQDHNHTATLGTSTSQVATQGTLAIDALNRLEVKGRAPKTGYSREQFSNDWGTIGGCSIRELILKRDLQNSVLDKDGCKVISGSLQDPYTGKEIAFLRGATSSAAVLIDHVVAVSDAWQKGAQQLNKEQRYNFYNDPLNLLAVDGPTNNKKGDGDAATWLPPNKDYRCRYVARQVAVKLKYALWVTSGEKDAIKRTLDSCPGQVLPLTQ